MLFESIFREHVPDKSAQEQAVIRHWNSCSKHHRDSDSHFNYLDPYVDWIAARTVADLLAHPDYSLLCGFQGHAQ